MITKPKNRYVLVESSIPLDVMSGDAAKGILNAVIFELGAILYVKANPKIVCQAGEKRFIFRVNRGYEEDLVLALSFIKQIEVRRGGLYTLKVSGTIRKLVSYSKKLESV